MPNYSFRTMKVDFGALVIRTDHFGHELVWEVVGSLKAAERRAAVLNSGGR